MSRSVRAALRPGYTVAAAIFTVIALLTVFAVWTSPPAAAATRYEAENATISQGVAESNHAGFSGTGFVNYNNVTGSYVEWSVNAASAGTASLTLGFANGTAVSRPMDIIVNGTLVRDELPFPGTGAWTTWQTVTTTVPLTAGANTIRAVATTANGGPNVDYLDVDVVAPPPPPPIAYQAENATISQGLVESNHAGFTGTGFVNYDNVTGSYVEWTVPAATAGNATIAIRYANGTAVNRPMDITVNGTLVRDELAFPGTGAWTTWQTVTTTVPLAARPDNKIRATATTANGGPNVDKIDVSGGGGDTERPTVPGQPSCSDIADTALTLSWGASTDNVGVVAYDIFHDGTQIDTAAGNLTTKRLTGLQSNFTYRLSVFARDAAGNVSDSSALATCRTLPIDDPVPPSRPGQPSYSNVTQNTVNLSWGASTDDRGVTAYLIRDSMRNDAVLHTVTGNPPPTSTTVPGLTYPDQRVHRLGHPMGHLLGARQAGGAGNRA